MNITISVIAKELISNDRYISIQDGNYELRIYGKKPLVFKEEPFCTDLVKRAGIESLDNIVPYSVGECFWVLLHDGRVTELAADYYCHERVYYTIFDDKVNISDDWRILPHKNLEWNRFMMLYFLNWDSTLDGQTYFEELEYFCPTYKYVFEDTNKVFNKAIMPFNTTNRYGFHDALVKTLEATKQDCNSVGIMLSGGMDSSEITYAMQEIGWEAKYYCSRITGYRMFDNVQDCIGAETLAKYLNLDFNYADCNLEDFLKYWNGEMEKHVAFAYKDGRFWQTVIQMAKRDKVDLILNGNNADYFYEFGYTVDEHAGERNDGVDYFRTMRFVTTNSNLDAVFRDKRISEELLEAWQRYNDVPFTEERFLAWIMTNGNCYPAYNGLVVNECCKQEAKNKYDADLQSLLSDLITLYRDNCFANSRHLVLESTMIGNIDGENARAIMGSCKSNNMDCFIVHCSPLLFDASINMVFSEKTIDEPKKETQEYLKTKQEYLKANSEKRKLQKQSLMEPSGIWKVIFEQLNSLFDVNKALESMMSICRELDVFEEEELRKVVKEDIGVKIRMAWMGHIFDIYRKSMR